MYDMLVSKPTICRINGTAPTHLLRRCCRGVAFRQGGSTGAYRPAALSTQIQALERELGVQLFVRSTRRVELTVAGETFYNRSVRILSDIDMSAQATRSAAGKTVRKIRIGTIYPATIGVLPTFCRRSLVNIPTSSCRSRAARPAISSRSLESGQINLGFIPARGEHRKPAVLLHGE